MKNLLNRLKSVSLAQWLALALVILGLGVMIYKARGMLEFYKEVQYASQHDFAAGNLSPDLIRPWMSLRYVAAAFAVPQQYLYQAANIQPKKETSMIAINRLNSQMDLGKVDGQPALMQTLRAAILAYRANPVATGLLEKQVENWMTMQYVANSCAISVESLFEGLNLPAQGNAYKPLNFLATETDYSGGPKALLANIQKIVDERCVKPAVP
jgi:hypothetical protein